MAERKKLTIIDGKSVFYRGYYAMPNLSTKDGTPTGGVYGFAVLALELIKRLNPDYVCVAWDKPKTNIRKRKEIYPEYKANRKPPPPDFYEQIPLLHDLLDSFGWPLYELDDYEADDIMGALAVQAREKDIDTMLITSDLDLLQVINGNVHVYALKKGFSNIELYHPESFEAKYGVRVEQFLDLKSLKGDSSDNIPGAPGIGEKTAVKLLQDYDNLDNIYKNLDEIKSSTRDKLIAGKESVEISKQLARIWTDAPIKLDLKEVDGRHIKPDKVLDLLENLEFRSLTRQAKETLDLSGAVIERKIVDKYEGEIIHLSSDLNELPDFTKGKLFIHSLVEDKLGKKPALIIFGCDTKKTYVANKSVLSDKNSCSKLLNKIVEAQQIIGHELKPLLKVLIENDIVLPKNIFDINVAAFLDNSLEPDISLEGLARNIANWSGASFEDLDVHKTEELAGEIVQNIANIYETLSAKISKDKDLEKLAVGTEMPMVCTLAKMEKKGIYLDKEYLLKLGEELSDQISDIEQEIYGHADEEFNINSPRQLADILFEKLALPTIGIKKGKTGYSTAAGELTKLKFAHPIIDLIQNYREVSKLMNTYINTLPDQIDVDGRIHTSFSLTTAQTGRLSSHDPNLQNIPTKTDLGNKVRKAFKPGSGKVFISADYSQFELRLAAMLAGDKEMIDLFNDGIDIHTITASQIYGRNEEDVTKTMRRDAKVINFGILYGMSPHGLSEATGMNMTTAKDFIDKYFDIRKPLVEYLDKLKKQAIEQGYVSTYFGRKRYTPDVKSSNFVVRMAAERAAINMPIQGTASDIMKMAMIKIDKMLDQYDGADMLLQIHDSILVEADEKTADDLAHKIRDIMENVVKLPVNITVDTSIAKNWGDL